MSKTCVIHLISFYYTFKTLVYKNASKAEVFPKLNSVIVTCLTDKNVFPIIVQSFLIHHLKVILLTAFDQNTGGLKISVGSPIGWLRTVI